jgi:hypothetical protein
MTEALSPSRSSRVKASVVVLVGVVLGGCLAVGGGLVVVVVADVGGSLRTFLSTPDLRLVVPAAVIGFVLAADSYLVGGSRLTPKSEQIIVIG